MTKPETSDLALPQPQASADRFGLDCLVIVARHRGVHLSVPQLIHDNVLTGQHVTVPQLSEMRAIGKAEGESRAFDLGWAQSSEKSTTRSRHA